MDATVAAIAVAGARMAAVAVPTAADAPAAGRVSNAVGPAAQDLIGAIKEAVPFRRVVPNSFPRC